MALACAHCAAQAPDRVWDRIAALDFDEEVATLEQWFKELLDAEPPPPPVNGLWFGIFTRAEDHHVVSAFYVSGSAAFPAEEWIDATDWWPAGRYAPSSCHRALCDLAGQAGEPALSWTDGLLTFTHVAAVASALVRAVPGALLDRRPHLGVAAGFDDGDALLLGRLTGDGFDASDRGLL
jgi:hypothetical protein